MRSLATPAMQAGRRRRSAAVVLVAAAIAPLSVSGGILAAWAGDRRGAPLGPMFRAFSTGPASCRPPRWR